MGRNLSWRIALTLGSLVLIPSAGVADWQPHVMRQLNGKAEQIRLPAQFQIVTESWNRLAAVPYIVYMPEKDRLLMLVTCDLPLRAYVLTSDDRGANWTDPRPTSGVKNGKPLAGLATGLAYLGNGNVLFYAGSSRWFSSDFGETWGNIVPIAPASDGTRWRLWDPPLVERDPTTGKVLRIVETGYDGLKPPKVKQAHQQGHLRFSTDEGKTWSTSIKVPQWKEVSEVVLIRAGNGTLIGACRTDKPAAKKSRKFNDHYEGLGISLSKDNGHTWSTVKKLFDYGRHHPSLLRIPNGNIVMTYVVRKGYIDTKDGFPQFGIEAIVSRDHGRTWDLDHKYILHAWAGPHKGWAGWIASSQATSSQLLPDGSILTTFGTGYRIERKGLPRDVGLVQWRLNPEPVNDERTIRDAAFDSDLRNVFDPSPVGE